MTALATLHKYGKDIEERLQLKTAPIAVKMLEKEADIPAGAKRPLKDLGYHLSLCQAFSLARRQGETLALLKEDNWCYYPVIGCGLAEPPVDFLAGKSCYPDFMTKEACRNWSQALPRFEAGKYIGTVSAPLRTADFELDVVIIYCNSAQLTLLLTGLAYKDGRDVTCRLMAAAACVYAVVPVVQSGECQITVPCAGDRMRALAQDDEMILSVHREKMTDLMFGMGKLLDNLGFRFLTTPPMTPEYPLTEPYLRTARLMGIAVDK